MEYFTLNDGNRIPAVGFGVFLIPNDGSTYDAVRMALKAGYRHIDTAAAYFNEEEVGRAVRDSGIPRSEIFITSKLWLQDYGYEAAGRGIETSLQKLETDYIDLYLLHQPYFDVPGAWKALEEAKAAGKLRSIGVSNMSPKLFQKFVPQFAVRPAVNQVEYNPFCQQKELRKSMEPDQIRMEAYYPLGHGSQALLQQPLLQQLAQKYGKTPAQIILRFAVQEGVVVLPKSLNPVHMAENLDLFDFRLEDQEREEIRRLDTGKGSHDADQPGLGEKLLQAFKVHD